MKQFNTYLVTLFLLALALLVNLNSCRKDTVLEYDVTPCNCPDTLSSFGVSSSKANVRFKNNTPFNLCEVTFDPTATLSNPSPINDHFYGNIAPDQRSSFIPFDTVYRYGWVRVTVKNKHFYLQPYDYFGETPLSPGNYSYVISWRSEYGNDTLKALTLNLEVD